MALPLLTPFLIAILCLGLAAVLTVLTVAAVNLLKQAPVIGGWIENKAVAIEQAISGALGRAFAGIDHFIGGSIHLLARYVDELVGEIRSHAHMLSEIAATLVPMAHALRAVANLTHGIGKTFRGIEHGIRDLTKVWHGIEHRVKALEKDLAKGIGHDLRLHVKALEGEVDRLRHRVIPSIRSDVATAEGEIGNLYEWAKGKASLLGVGTFAYAVSVALAGLGLDWLSCKSRSSVNGLKNCGLWNAIEDALGFLAGAFLFASVCDFLIVASPLVSTLADEIIPPLASAGAGLCQGTIGPPPPLPAVALHLPANPGVTLYTP